MSGEESDADRPNEKKLSDLVQRINFDTKGLNEEEGSMMSGSSMIQERDRTVKWSNKIQLSSVIHIFQSLLYLCISFIIFNDTLYHSTM